VVNAGLIVVLVRLAAAFVDALLRHVNNLRDAERGVLRLGSDCDCNILCTACRAF
jgi:hypothetical protein